MLRMYNALPNISQRLNGLRAENRLPGKYFRCHSKSLSFRKDCSVIRSESDLRIYNPHESDGDVSFARNLDWLVASSLWLCHGQSDSILFPSTVILFVNYNTVGGNAYLLNLVPHACGLTAVVEAAAAGVGRTRGGNFGRLLDITSLFRQQIKL